MPTYGSIVYNERVFEQYLNRHVPDTRVNALLRSGVLMDRSAEIAPIFKAQTGSNAGSIPMKGLLGGDAANYNGATDIPLSEQDTFIQKYSVVGREKGWNANDFAKDITGGVDWNAQAGEVSKYYDNVMQDCLCNTLKGTFDMDNAKFTATHITDITAEETNNYLDFPIINTAAQKACGDMRADFNLLVVHSAVATNLANKKLLEYAKYTDAEGVERISSIAYVGNKLVIEDDNACVEYVYTLTSDTSVNASKVYYTRRSNNLGDYVYDVVAKPKTSGLSTYYEITETKYLTYLLGRNSIVYANVPTEFANEMERDATKNGGLTRLCTKRRFLFIPNGVSFSGTMVSPTNAELRDGSKYDLVSNHDGSEYIDAKALPIACIKSLA